jgi:hypothetical protein
LTPLHYIYANILVVKTEFGKYTIDRAAPP